MAVVLIISPHLDDACLSFGAQMASYTSAGHHVLVHTVFAGSPIPPFSPSADRYHRAWGITGDPVAPRREEDLRAMQLLGATSSHGDFLDAIYRRDEQGDWLVQPGSRPHTRFMPEEPHLSEAITARITALVEDHAPALVATAAAVGTHVDHQRARDSTIAACRATGAELRLWEDLPYALWTNEISPLPDRTVLTDRRIAACGKEAREHKYLAAAAYASQLPGLVYEGAGLFDLLDRRWSGLADEGAEAPYGEVVWTATDTSGQSRRADADAREGDPSDAPGL
ncbi:PIG-L family deacetylase [Streptomyces anulatus]|nr:PIG-L family deacetylase [Streptomyces anulatus]NDZ60727.1 PIG-L family deacetylase [Streptomyces anulatus]